MQNCVSQKKKEDICKIQTTKIRVCLSSYTISYILDSLWTQEDSTIFDDYTTKSLVKFK